MFKNRFINLEKGVACALTASAMSLLFGISSLASIPIADSGTPVATEQIQAVTNQYNMIPASIREYYEQCGNIIYFFDTNPLLKNLLGAYSGEEGRDAKIIITNQDYGGAEAITHEMGHFFDDICYKDEGTSSRIMVYKGIKFIVAEDGRRYISDSDEFKRIYEQEKQSAPVSSYEKTDANEYFAGAFGRYCTSPEKLKTYAPYTYDFIDKLVKDFSQVFPASAENVALTVQIPATIDEITGGATVSGILLSNRGGDSWASGLASEALSGNLTQVSGVTSSGISYTGYTTSNIGTEAGAANTQSAVDTAVAAASQGDGTKTVVNADGSVTTTTVQTTERGTLVSVVTTYSKTY